MTLARAGRALLRAAWLLVLPAALAVASMRVLVPDDGPMADVARGAPFAVGALFFVVYSSLAAYWAPRPERRADASRRGAIALFAVTVAAAVAGALFRAHLFEGYRVLSDSMLPTFETGDLVAAFKRAYPEGGPPRRGDVIVFRNPTAVGPEVLVKRVIGLPGDHVTMRGGHAVVDGRELPTCDAGTYVYALEGGGAVHGRLLVEVADGHAYLTVHTPLTRAFTTPYEVKPGEVFVLGDNRNNSEDSRAWNDGHGGGVPESSILGRADRLVFGVHRDGRPDLGALLRPLAPRLRLEGVDVRAVQESIDRCLREGVPPVAQATR